MGILERDEVWGQVESDLAISHHCSFSHRKTTTQVELDLAISHVYWVPVHIRKRWSLREDRTRCNHLPPLLTVTQDNHHIYQSVEDEAWKADRTFVIIPARTAPGAACSFSNWFAFDNLPGLFVLFTKIGRKKKVCIVCMCVFVAYRCLTVTRWFCACRQTWTQRSRNTRVALKR